MLQLIQTGGGVVQPPLSTNAGFWGGIGIANSYNGAGAIAWAGTGNQVRFRRFVLPYRTRVKFVSTQNNGTSSGKLVTVGIYTADAATKLIDSGTFDGGSNSVQTKTITPVTLDPGEYLFAWSCDLATTVTCGGAFSMASAFTSILNANTAKNAGTAGNAMSGGVLPSSLGALTATDVGNMPYVYFGAE